MARPRRAPRPPPRFVQAEVTLGQGLHRGDAFARPRMALVRHVFVARLQEAVPRHSQQLSGADAPAPIRRAHGLPVHGVGEEGVAGAIALLAAPLRAQRPAVEQAQRGRRWRLEGAPEREREGRLAVGAQEEQALHGLFERRLLAGVDPPHREVRLRHPHEPFRPVAQGRPVARAVDVTVERGRRSPYGHVHQDRVVVEDADAGGVAAVRLQAPDEARASVGDRVDRLELADEAGHDRVVEGGDHLRDVDLRELAHACLLGAIIDPTEPSSHAARRTPR